ncbi:inactive protein RESTRICTED TEV MOVEMENT 2-like [Cornus florida]|uniref:inactive protein RESTRICTED TEV MOVEMENT 2-like n=1 Tax=Cornus florida TaxID=4283 RepID=UPI00289A3C31|nr:inactive protein RESTRICTED TEV MOVEMENT 2-like [Cornus florida]
MAMRTLQTSGTMPSHPMHEDFKPLSEWKEEEGADILLVYLPGFIKEQMKVLAEGQNTLRVRGERLVGTNKWSRFQEYFPIPENSNLGGIRAKFEGGILSITIPRKSIPQPQVSPRVEARATQEAARSPQEATSKQRDTKIVRPPLSPPKMSPPKVAPAKPDQKAPQENFKAKADHLEDDSAKQRDTKIVHPLSPPKIAPVKPEKGPQEDIQAKADLENEKAKQRDTKSVHPIPPKVQNDNKQTDERSTSASPKAQRGQDQEPLKAISGAGNQKQTEEKPNERRMPKKRKEPAVAENVIVEVAKKRRKENDEKKERQLIVNMGVAALVTVALGAAYIAYSFGSSGKAKH